MKKLFLILITCLFINPFVNCQKSNNKIDEKVRFSADSLEGIYIPKSLEDCFKQIDGFWADSIKTKVKALPEDEFTGRLHMGFGMWMRNNWQLWGGSRLSKYFNELGIHHPDDMSGIILDSYHRYLNNQEIQLDEQIQHYKDYWERIKKEDLERKKTEFSDYQVGDTVLFNYSLGFSSSKQEKKYDSDVCVAKGIIISKEEDKFQINVRLVESCDRKGIIYFDSDNTRVFNDKTNSWEKPMKREIKYMKKGMEIWFDYSNWETI
jgi:hypothetical protein